MISMKLSPAEAKAETMLAEANEAPEYPYGLSICLDDEVLAKLGITEMPAIGSTFMLTARVEVCSTSQYQNQDGADKSMSLQITDMELAGEGAAQKSIADRIYG